MAGVVPVTEMRITVAVGVTPDGAVVDGEKPLGLLPQAQHPTAITAADTTPLRTRRMNASNMTTRVLEKETGRRIIGATRVRATDVLRRIVLSTYRQTTYVKL